MSTLPNRREPRFPLQISTLVFGFDRAGRAFMEQAQTLDISSTGARLTGVTSEVLPGTILAVQQGDRRARFQVLWTGESGSEAAGHIGLQCVEAGGHTRKRILHVGVANPGVGLSHLEGAGYDVVCRDEVRQAQEAFQVAAFDLLLLRVSVAEDSAGTNVRPGSLEEFAVYVRESSPRTRILLVSPQPARIPESLMGVADGFVQDSASRHELLSVVEEMIGAGNQIRWPLARFASRYAMQVPVELRLQRDGRSRALAGRSSDISELGLGVDLEDETPLAVGELIELRFHLPGVPHLLTPRAAVRRATGRHYGFEFVSIERVRLEDIRLTCQTLPRLSLSQPV